MTRLIFIFCCVLFLAPGLASGVEAPVDSLGAALAEADSLQAGSGTSGPVDPGDAESPSEQDSSDLAGAADSFRAPMLPAFHPELLKWRRPDTFEDVVEAIPGASLRVAGDEGMPAFLSLSPISGPAPEIWYDGVPTRGASDRDPGVWDRSAIGVNSVHARSPDGGGAWGGPQLWVDHDRPLEGRTFLRSYFSSVQANETYSRGISVTTPASARVVRLDFEEWKTEEGIEYSDAPEVVSRPLLSGRSKMRRFRFSTDLETQAGRLQMAFGRGRRYHRGTPLRPTSTERWTGELSVGLDRQDADRVWRARVYHLDTHDADEAYGQTDSGARSGVRIDRLPARDGIQWGFWAESAAARFATYDLGSPVERMARATEARTSIGWRADPERASRVWANVEGVWSDRTAQPFAATGALGGAHELGRLTLGASAERILRTPTLVETIGRFSFDAPRPTDGGYVYDDDRREWKWRGSGGLPFESQDRLSAFSSLRLGRLHVQFEVSRHRLRDGVGLRWTSTQHLLVGGGVELDVDQVALRWNWSERWGDWRVRTWGHGHRVLGELELVEGRGSGWPTEAVRARIGIDRRFFADHNRLGLDFELDALGEHGDDLTGAFGGVVPASTVLDLEFWLAIREAEIALAYDNLLDAERSEVLGTRRRGRQMRLVLSWPFTN